MGSEANEQQSQQEIRKLSKIESYAYKFLAERHAKLLTEMKALKEEFIEFFESLGLDYEKVVNIQELEGGNLKVIYNK